MNMELLQNSDVLMRILLLFIPAAVTFLAAIIYLFVSKKNGEKGGLNAVDLQSAAMLFLAVYATNFLYSVMEILLMLVREDITADRIAGEAAAIFAAMGVLNALSCIAKGIIGGRKLPYCAGADKQNGLSKALVYMAAAEIPGLAALAIYMIKFFM